MIPLIGTILISVVGQLGLKLAIDAGKKLFANSSPAGSGESFPAQLERQMDQRGTSAPTVNGAVAFTHLPPGLQAPSVPSATDVTVPIREAVDAYRRFEAAWPGRSVSSSPISPQQAP